MQTIQKYLKCQFLFFIQDSLQNIQRQIHNFEGNYIEETKQYGNILDGWDKYLSTKLDQFKYIYFYYLS